MRLLTFAVWIVSWPALANLMPLPTTPPTPADNPTTPEKVHLGKALYFDKRLSKNDTVSCNSCHDVTNGRSGTDDLPVSTGIHGQKGGRNAPTVWNAAFQSVQFWDGRAKSLEEQAKGPITNPIEMGMPSHEAVIKKLAKIPFYKRQFEKVFGKAGLTIDNLAKAIAAFERTLITPNSPVDRYLRGDKKALSALAQRGLKTFQNVGCVTCHRGANYSGETVQGHGFYMRFPLLSGTEFEKTYDLTSDKGRFESSKDPVDRHMWRVPTLRNIARTAPYFHNGKVQTLDEAVRVMGKTQLGRDLSKTQISEIVAFLEGLNGELPKITEPKPST